MVKRGEGEVSLPLTLRQNFCTSCFVPVLRDKRKKRLQLSAKQGGRGRGRGLKPSRRCPPTPQPHAAVPANKELPDGPAFLAPTWENHPHPRPPRGNGGARCGRVEKCFTGGQGEEARRRGREQKLAEDTRRTAGHVFDREPAAQRGGRLQTTAPHVLSGSGASTAIFHGIQARGCGGEGTGDKTAEKAKGLRLA